MHILVIEPERRPELKEIDGSLESMQDIVGGLIQVIYPFGDPVVLVCNDEGTGNRVVYVPLGCTPMAH